MIEEKLLKETLEEMRPAPDPERAERAARAVAERVVPGGRPRRRRRLQIGLLSALALIGFSLSPPGQALAERFGELVGIGEESSIREANLRDPRLTKTQTRVGPAIVTASGTVPKVEEPFEILAWAARYKRPTGVPDDVGSPTQTGELVSCMGQVYPRIGRQETGKVCLGPDEAPQQLHVFGMGRVFHGAASEESEAPYLVVGQAAPETERVEVTYQAVDGTSQQAETYLGVIDEEVMDKTGIEQPFSFFVAFLPYDGTPQPRRTLADSPTLKSVLVRSFDSAGNELRTSQAGQRYERVLKQNELRDLEHRRSVERFKRAGQLAACRAYPQRAPREVCAEADSAVGNDSSMTFLADSLDVRERDGIARVRMPGAFRDVEVPLDPDG